MNKTMNNKILFYIILTIAFFGSNSCYAENKIKCLDVGNDIKYCIMPNGDKCYIYNEGKRFYNETYNFGFSCIAK